MKLIEWLGKIRNSLLQEAKKEKSDDYRSGYCDGVLDNYNQTVCVISPILGATEVEEKK